MNKERKIKSIEIVDEIKNTKEEQESNDLLDKKIDHLIELLKKSKHPIIITGAGISTSCGISDYRGPKGLWTLKKQNIKNVQIEKEEKEKQQQHDMLDIKPSISHMAIYELIKLNLIKYVITQNVDGLHRKSGLIEYKNMVEVHGCRFVEKCIKCKRRFERNYRVCNRVNYKSHHHKTSNKCEICGGECCDVNVKFGEECEHSIWEMTEVQSMTSDLCIVIGTTLALQHMKPLPLYAKENGGHIVIINLMEISLDKDASLIIRATADHAFVKLFDKLDLKIPDFKKWEPVNKTTIPPYVTEFKVRKRKLPQRSIEGDTGDYNSGSEDEDRNDFIQIGKIFEGCEWPTGTDKTQEWRMKCTEKYMEKISKK